jgi:hypothetical protein
VLTSSIRSWLLTQPAVTGVVGARVFVDDVPENTPQPYVIITGIGDDENITLGGDNVPTGGLFTAEIDIDAKASTRGGANALGDAIGSTNFRNFSGSLGGGLETVDAVESTGKVDGKDTEPLFANDQAFFRRTLSFTVYYRPLA